MQDIYFLHGDLNTATGLYFCRRCDKFTTPDHFSDLDHKSEMDRQLEDSLASLRRRSANLPSSSSRPANVNNLFANNLPDRISKRLKFNESFLNWLSRSTDNPQILEAARNHPHHKTNPSYDDILEILWDDDQAELQTLYQKYLQR
jgi:hypothetical protein